MFLFNNRFGFDDKLYLEKYFSVGIHPWDGGLDSSVSELEKIIADKNCLAIGECGLDKLIEIDIEVQKKVFMSQLDLAVKYQKPVIIHCVKAFDELIDICKPYQMYVPLIIHGFNKSHQLAKQLIEQGFYISLNPSVFKKNDFDFNEVPLEKLFLETDDNVFISIKEVYKTAAVHFKIAEEDLKEKIYCNFTPLFKDYGR